MRQGFEAFPAGSSKLWGDVQGNCMKCMKAEAGGVGGTRLSGSFALKRLTSGRTGPARKPVRYFVPKEAYAESPFPSPCTVSPRPSNGGVQRKLPILSRPSGTRYQFFHQTPSLGVVSAPGKAHLAGSVDGCIGRTTEAGPKAKGFIHFDPVSLSWPPRIC